MAVGEKERHGKGQTHDSVLGYWKTNMWRTESMRQNILWCDETITLQQLYKALCLAEPTPSLLWSVVAASCREEMTNRTEKGKFLRTACFRVLETFHCSKCVYLTITQAWSQNNNRAALEWGKQRRTRAKPRLDSHTKLVNDFQAMQNQPGAVG